MDLTRTQLLNGHYNYPNDLVRVYPTKHFKWRLDQRGIGVDCIPSLIRVTENNIHSGKTVDGKNLNSVVVRLVYNSKRYIFLAFNPFDGAMKTLWFRDKHKKNKYDNRTKIPRAPS